MKAKRDYYLIMGITPMDGEPEIKKAYKELAKKYHPDLNPGMRSYAEEKMVELTEAYDTLLDSEKKKEYDNDPLFVYKYPKLIDPATKDIKIAKDEKKKTGPSFLDKLKKMMLKEPEEPPKEPSELNRKAAEHFSIALTYLEKRSVKMLDMAEIEMKVTLNEVPANYEALYDMGLIQYKQGNYEAAISFFSKAARSSEGDTDAKKMLELLNVESL
jgi:DnaJ-class molecular chaperone